MVAVGGSWREWAFGTLGAAIGDDAPVGVLTAPTTLNALQAGYRSTGIPLVASP